MTSGYTTVAPTNVGFLDTPTYNSDKTVSKTTVSPAKNLVNVSVTSDLIDAVCAQLDAQTTAWT